MTNAEVLDFIGGFLRVLRKDLSEATAQPCLCRWEYGSACAPGTGCLTAAPEPHYAEQLGINPAPRYAAPERCTVPPPGWNCSRVPGHDGPCAAQLATPELSEEQLVDRAEVRALHRRIDALCADKATAEAQLAAVRSWALNQVDDTCTDTRHCFALELLALLTPSG